MGRSMAGGAHSAGAGSAAPNTRPVMTLAGDDERMLAGASISGVMTWPSSRNI